MAATTIDRDTPFLFFERQIAIPLAAATKIPAGAIVCTNASGLAVNGTDTAGLKMAGRAEHAADSGAGDTTILVGRGVFFWANAGDVVDANRGAKMFIVDNQTVTAAATTNNIVAGYMDQLNAIGVAVAVLGGRPEAA